MQPKSLIEVRYYIQTDISWPLSLLLPHTMFHLFHFYFLYLSLHIPEPHSFFSSPLSSFSSCFLLSGTETKKYLAPISNVKKSGQMLCESDVNAMTTSNMMIYRSQTYVYGRTGMCYWPGSELMSDLLTTSFS